MRLRVSDAGDDPIVAGEDEAVFDGSVLTEPPLLLALRSAILHKDTFSIFNLYKKNKFTRLSDSNNRRNG